MACADVLVVPPAALGDRAEAMLADIEARLLPFSQDGVLKETLMSAASVARRL